MDASPLAVRMVSMLKDFYRYCAGILLGSPAANVAGTSKLQRHRYPREHLPPRGVSIHSTDGYQIISFLERQHNGAGTCDSYSDRRHWRNSELRRRRMEESVVRKRRPAVAVPVEESKAVSWRLVNRNSNIVIDSSKPLPPANVVGKETAENVREWGRKRDTERRPTQQPVGANADTQCQGGGPAVPQQTIEGGGSRSGERLLRKIREDAWQETTKASIRIRKINVGAPK